MLNGEKEILIEKFFRGELSADELQVFKDLLQSDAEFRAEVELQRSVVSGISAYSKGLLKTELAGIHKAVKPDLKEYQPSGNGGSWFGKAFKLFMLTAVVGAGAYAYVNREQIKPYTDKIWSTFVRMDTVVVPATPVHESQKHSSGKVDTVWHIIHTTKVRKGDTVIITSEEDWRDKMDVKKNATIKSDTMFLEEGRKSVPAQ